MDNGCIWLFICFDWFGYYNIWNSDFENINIFLVLFFFNLYRNFVNFCIIFSINIDLYSSFDDIMRKWGLYYFLNVDKWENGGGFIFIFYM